MTKIKKSYCFDDVLLVPQYSEISSRREVDISSNLEKDISLEIPIISSPMDTVTESSMCVEMSRLGGMGIIHRYNSIEDQSSIAREALKNGAKSVGCAVGVSGDYVERAQASRGAGANVICVDIAHGHHSLMRHALKTLRNTLGYDIHIMAGNVATLDAFNDLSGWGADSIRVGIGGGSICSTRVQTGHGMPTLSSIIDCSQSDRSAVLIADGGIRTSGDIVKALAAGADVVMLGSLLAATTESPGEYVFLNGSRYKTYRGMASVEAQLDWRGHTSSIEGVSSYVPTKGSVETVIQSLVTGIKSGLSYSGVTTIPELQSRSRFISQSFSGSVESSTHINKIV